MPKGFDMAGAEPADPGVSSRRTTDDGVQPIAEPASRYLPASDLAVVTSYFNSHHYASKRRVFELFKHSMERSGVPLFIAECAFGDDEFELPPSASVFRFRSRDVLWQKERLLNLTIDRVPDRFTKIAWIDADVLFDNARWTVDASELLDELRVIQLFSHAIRLRPNETTYFGGGQRYRSFCFTRAALPALSRLAYLIHGHTGFAWAADRQLLSDLGLYDAAIAGSADHLMAHAFCGDFSSQCLRGIFGTCSGYLDHFREWAEVAWEHVAGRLGFVPGAALHLWHGETVNRAYFRRNRDLDALQFDPSVHLLSEPDGVWSWSEDAASLSEWASGYFRDRREDTAGSAQGR